MKYTNYRLCPDFYNEIVEALERTIILLEDNPKIKDSSKFYNSLGQIEELSSILKSLKEE